MSKDPDLLEKRIMQLNLQTGGIGTTSFASFAEVKKAHKITKIFRDTEICVIFSTETAKGETQDMCFFRRKFRHGSEESGAVAKAGVD